MFAKTHVGYILFSFLMATEQAFGRERWLERNNKPVLLHPRRFSQEHPTVLQKLQQACPGQVCGALAGQAVTPLLAAQPECSQQDMADAIIDASRQFDNATQANMIAIAQEYRQAEKNTPPDFSTNPPTLRNSVFCQKAPNNSELNGLVQGQDPANDPNIFFDPATGQSVKKGSQPNTLPFNGGGANGSSDRTLSAAASGPAASSAPVLVATPVAAEVPQSGTGCPTAITITVSATNPAVASMTGAVMVTVGTPSQLAAPTPTASSPAGGADFGSCTTPEIEFGVGFDNRKETSFRPVDNTSYPHGSAQNINIITQFMCDSLTNTCKANQAAKNLCATASTAASSAKAGTGAQADAFNSIFGIQTKFAAVASVDNQGKPVPGTGAANASTAVTASVTSSVAASAAASTASSSGGSANGIGNFGSCSTPEIEFGVGFDNRKETSFRPADLASFNHGSAQNIDIITQFICDQLTNSCKADQTAKNTCAQATTAADNATPKGSGAQADAFNAVFSIQTNFASVQQVDDQGRPVGAAGAAGPVAGLAAGPAAGAPRVQAASTSTAAATIAAAATSPLSLSNNNSSNIQTFTGALGGVTAPAVRDLGNGRFAVDGNSNFNSKQNALVRSCDVQNNKCADAANTSGNQNGFTVQACNTQQTQCEAAARA